MASAAAAAADGINYPADTYIPPSFSWHDPWSWLLPLIPDMLEANGKGGSWKEGDVDRAKEHGGGQVMDDGDELVGRWKEAEWGLGDVPVVAPPVAVRA